MSGTFEPVAVISGLFAFMLAYCSQAVYNNILDIEGDRINAPERPLARGAISVHAAWMAYAFLILLALVSACIASFSLIPFILMIIFLGYVYSRYTKSMGMLSYMTLATTHLCIPLVAAYTMFVPMNMKIIFAAVFVFITNFVAISVKDFKDVEGDKAVGLKTLPVKYGVRTASLVTFAGFLVLPFIFWLPWYFLHLSTLFVLFYMVLGAVRIIKGYNLLKDPSPKVANNILKDFRFLLMLEMVAWCLG